MNVSHVDAVSDPRIADYRNVPDRELIARRGLFVAEGRLVVERLLASTFRSRSVLVTETAFEALRRALSPHPDVPVFVVPSAVMNGITGFNIHRGCLALAERPPALDWRSMAAGARRLVVMERIGNADNVGAMFRNAAAFGADGVLIGPACADPLYRKAIRTSMGTALMLPFAPAAPLPEVLGALRADGWAIVGLELTPEVQPLRMVVPTIQGRQTAIVAGHEGEGLTAAALRACTHRARIPMAAGIDSLNVATAAAIALYEIAS